MKMFVKNPRELSGPAPKIYDLVELATFDEIKQVKERSSSFVFEAMVLFGVPSIHVLVYDAAMKPISQESLEQIFTKARTHNGWLNQPVSDDTLQKVYDLLKWGP